MKIETFNFEKTKDLLSRLEHYENSGGEEILNGFKYFGNSYLEGVESTFPYVKYELEKDLSSLEKQKEPKENRTNYHRSILAKSDNKLVGILFCNWVKHSLWNYHLQLIEVHKDFRKKGVGTKLIKELNNSDFIKNKIVYIGMFTEDGIKYIKKKISKELKAKDYALIFENFQVNGEIELGTHGSP